MSVNAKAEAAMKERIEKLKVELSGVRTGRANPQMLEPLRVEYYGAMVPVKQVANVAVAEGRTLEIRPFDPTVLVAIEKAIQKSDLGVVPQNDSKIIRLNFPTMNEERRKDVAKMVGKIGEEYRVSIRSDRQDAMHAVKKQVKDDGLPEDQAKGLEGGIQKLTDEYIAKVDALIAEKQQEITTI